MSNIHLFYQSYSFEKIIQKGGEGKVSAWRHLVNKNMWVAVKEPRKDSRVLRNQLMKEAKNLHTIGNHPNIVQFYGYDNSHPNPPTLFFEMASLGDLPKYKVSLMRARQLNAVPEATLWKLVADMVKALHWMHNGHSVPYVHGDIKPSNILAVSPPGTNPSDIPLLPTFKLCDFTHMVPYREDGPGTPFYGTPEYAPPHVERRHVNTPIDIYGLGATLQEVALDVLPVLSNIKFRDYWRMMNKTPPSLRELNNDDHRWRWDIPVIYRPLNIPLKQQIQWDVPNPRATYSDELNEWYTRLLHHSLDKRFSAAVLHQYFIPVADVQIRLLVAKFECSQAAKELSLSRTAWKVRREGKDSGCEDGSEEYDSPSTMTPREVLFTKFT